MKLVPQPTCWVMIHPSSQWRVNNPQIQQTAGGRDFFSNDPDTMLFDNLKSIHWEAQYSIQFQTWKVLKKVLVDSKKWKWLQTKNYFRNWNLGGYEQE